MMNKKELEKKILVDWAQTTFDYNQWFEFSMNPQSEEDIRERAIYDALLKTNSICYSYICRFSQLSEKFIEEMMFITSGLFSFEYYDQKHIDYVVDLIDKGFKFKPAQESYIYELAHKIRSTEGKGKPSKDPVLQFVSKLLRTDNIIEDKLDWFYLLSYQNLSPAFIKKHSTLFVEEERKKQLRDKYIYE